MEEKQLPDYDVMDLTPEERQEEVKSQIDVDVDEILGRTTQQNPAEPKALQVADFAKRIANLNAVDTAYDMKLGRQEENPFQEEPPYLMDSTMFVYWAYQQAGIDLGDPLTFSMPKLKRTIQLEDVANVGSNYPIDRLIPGDVVFFFPKSNHAGIYVGEKSFVAFNGSGIDNYNGGAQKQRIDEGYWKDHFLGHVKRYNTKEKRTAKPL